MSLREFLSLEPGEPYLNHEGRLCVDIHICGEVVKYYLWYNEDGTYKLEEIGKDIRNKGAEGTDRQD